TVRTGAGNPSPPASLSVRLWLPMEVAAKTAPATITIVIPIPMIVALTRRRRSCFRLRSLTSGIPIPGVGARRSARSNSRFVSSIVGSDPCCEGRASAGSEHANGGRTHAEEVGRFARGHIEQIHQDERGALRPSQSAEGTHHDVARLDSVEFVG